MAIQANVVSQQTMELDLAAVGNGSASRLYITSGIAQFNLSVTSNPGQFATQNASVKVLVGPALAEGKFRKAVGVVGLGTIGWDEWSPSQPVRERWSIDDVETTLDDETGKVELRFDLSIHTNGGSTYTQSVTFQVTTLAVV